MTPLHLLKPDQRPAYYLELAEICGMLGGTLRGLVEAAPGENREIAEELARVVLERYDEFLLRGINE